MKHALMTTFACLLVVAPAATAFQSPVGSLKDCIPTSNVTQSEWTAVPDKGYVLNLFIVGTLCGNEGGPADGEAEVGAVGDFAIACEVVVTEKTTDKGWGFNVLFFEVHSYTVTVKLTSELTCDGSFVITLRHGGAIGPRTATGLLGDASFDAAGTALRLAVPVRQSADSCEYFDPLVKTCTTAHSGVADYKASFVNQVIESITICAPFEWRHDLTYLPGLAAATGGDSVCSAPILLKALNL